MNSFSERTEMIQPEPAQALGALLGVPAPDLAGGAGLPLLWHWLYLLDRPAQADLGPDGAPLRGTIAAFDGQDPQGRRRRRMWAGGRVRASGPLRCGYLATKHSRVLSVNEKQGKSGPLTFIIIEHRILQNGRVVIEEQQDIVYRISDPAIGTPPPSDDGPPFPPAVGEWAIDVTPTLLFRFSALTYNAHRIHYDRDYAKQVEGYPGLLTQGPLQAIAMAEAARAAEDSRIKHPAPLHYDYRLTAPLFDHQGMIVTATRHRDTVTTAVRDTQGRQTASGTLQPLTGETIGEEASGDAVPRGRN